jgi:copper chaperone CopZ/thiol-disulfide isomerase/thioredoxin
MKASQRLYTFCFPPSILGVMPSRVARVVSVSLAFLALSLSDSTAWADRVQVYSIQGADCATCGDKVRAELKKVKGVKKVEFDIHKVEITVQLEDGVPDSEVLAAAERAGLRAIVGAGQGSYLPHEAYPAGADVQELNKDGSTVGPLAALRVPGKFTVFDVYADWCGPCRDVDARLRVIVAERKDVAVRKLSVVDFDSPLAKELAVDTLPYVVVFTPSGKKTEIRGAQLDKIDKALKPK